MKNIFTVLLAGLFAVSCTTTNTAQREISSVSRVQIAADALVDECDVAAEIIQAGSENEQAIWDMLTEKDSSGRMKIEDPACINGARSLYESMCRTYEDLRDVPACEILLIVAQNDRALNTFDTLTPEQKAEIHSNMQQRVRLLTSEKSVEGQRLQEQGAVQSAGAVAAMALGLTFGAMAKTVAARIGSVAVWVAGAVLLAKGLDDLIDAQWYKEYKTTVTAGDPFLDPRLNGADRLNVIRLFVNETNAAHRANQENR